MLSAQLPTSAPGLEPPRSPPRYDANASRKFRMMRGLGRRLDPNDPHVIREAAALLTSQLFFAPLLAEMRKLPFGREFGHGGRLEEAFGEQLDQRIADTVARCDRGLTPQVAKRLAQKSQAAAAAGPTQPQALWPVQRQVRQAIDRDKS
ncbi:MAG: hypothetical protein ACE5I3_07085 [Phycisphaerae bacterium]